jgi:catechol 2,3-dioxygenase-like lactoylglutathione lyase family enzyme
MAPIEFSIREVTIAVKDIAAAAERLGGALQSPRIDGVVEFPAENLELRMGGIWVGDGDFHVALVHDTSGRGPVGRFLEKRGEGIYELNVRTNDLPAAIEHMKGQGFRFISETPHVLPNYEWYGEIWSELRIVFVDPSTAHGVLVEVAEWIK